MVLFYILIEEMVEKVAPFLREKHENQTTLSHFFVSCIFSSSFPKHTEKCVALRGNICVEGVYRVY